ncbi:hypothetical protein C8R46DRAFT_1353630 [Mycena filopes]|nr:hypothetical protein C8R46DRAFT_1353630 [Mycena filopes]
MTFTESTSVLLVVCKSWLRVATPLLYNVVVLRSKAQAQALAATLTANPALGAFTRKLRVEGGYAISMLKILQTSKNITDLCLSVDVTSSDNACGLCRGLPLLDPVRIILTKTSFNRISPNAQKLLDVIEKCIPTWKKLTVFELQNSLGPTTTIPKALAQAPNLATFVLLDPSFVTKVVPAYVNLVAANTSLKRIRIQPPWVPDTRFSFLIAARKSFYEDVQSNKQWSAFFNLADLPPVPAGHLSPTPTNNPPLMPFIYPKRLAADPAQEDAIWSRVLYFSLYDDGSKPKYQRRSYFPLTTSKPPRLASLLVSKSFARLGIPHLYESPVLDSAEALQSFTSQLALKPSLGGYVRCLTIPISITDTLGSILFQTTNMPVLKEVRALKGYPSMTWKAFSDLGESTASSLELFHGISITHGNTTAANPAIFAAFPRMRELEWKSSAVFKTKSKLITAGSFSLLVHLTVTSFNGSFLIVLSQMELSSLQTAVFTYFSTGGAAFFQKHGPKLLELTLSPAQLGDPELAIWRNCSSMKVLGVSCSTTFPATSSCLNISETHAILERIVFKTSVNYWSLKQAHKTALNKLMLALPASASDFLPALREVVHPFCEWPTSEPGIWKSRWVAWAEDLLEQGGIHLVGSTGVRWRPRLKFVSKSKK